TNRTLLWLRRIEVVISECSDQKGHRGQCGIRAAGHRSSTRLSTKIAMSYSVVMPALSSCGDLPRALTVPDPLPGGCRTHWPHRLVTAFIRHDLALNRLGEPGRDRRRVGDRSAHDDRLGAGPTGGSGLIGCVDAAFGDEHRSQTGLTDGADEFEIGAGYRCALAGVAGQRGADDVGTGLGCSLSIAEAAAIGHDQGVRLFVEASD